MVSLLLVSFIMIVLQNQSQSVSGVGAHHQNAHDGHAIQTFI